MTTAKKCNRGYTFQRPQINPLGDAALIVRYAQAIDPAVHAQVTILQDQLKTSHTAGITGFVPSYAALTIHYDPRIWSFDGLREHVCSLEQGNPARKLHTARQVEIPVIYGGTHGPDLDDMSRRLALPVEEIIKRHTSRDYRVYFIGFQPGFPYMGGLDEIIATPRLLTPRTLVPAGSVGVAGNQTGIYPQDSPGGWNIIGWTPLKLFDPSQDPPSILAAGDTVHFFSIDVNKGNHA